jgi:hypothetical protein
MNLSTVATTSHANKKPEQEREDSLNNPIGLLKIIKAIASSDNKSRKQQSKQKTKSITKNEDTELIQAVLTTIAHNNES